MAFFPFLGGGVSWFPGAGLGFGLGLGGIFGPSRCSINDEDASATDYEEEDDETEEDFDDDFDGE